jgi:hypothetical protein
VVICSHEFSFSPLTLKGLFLMLGSFCLCGAGVAADRASEPIVPTAAAAMVPAAAL